MWPIIMDCVCMCIHMYLSPSTCMETVCLSVLCTLDVSMFTLLYYLWLKRHSTSVPCEAAIFHCVLLKEGFFKPLLKKGKAI